MAKEKVEKVEKVEDIEKIEGEKLHVKGNNPEEATPEKAKQVEELLRIPVQALNNYLHIINITMIGDPRGAVLERHLLDSFKAFNPNLTVKQV